jgi:cytochrome c biogenesis protein CcmG, thiol:disulfide interchange protein DsbE
MTVDSAAMAGGGAADDVPEPADAVPESADAGPQAAPRPGREPAGWARGTARRAGRIVAGHKIISGIVAVLAVAAIAVSLATSSPGTPKSQPPAQPAAGFSLPVLGAAGQHVSLSQYAGKPVIVNFWASWCGPCQQETPLLASWYKQQHGKVVLLGLDENDSQSAALKFAQAKGVTYPLGFDPNVTVAPAYGVDALPQTFFLNAKHQIVDHVLGAVTMASLDKGLALMDSAS